MTETCTAVAHVESDDQDCWRVAFVNVPWGFAPIGKLHITSDKIHSVADEQTTSRKLAKAIANGFNRRERKKPCGLFAVALKQSRLDRIRGVDAVTTRKHSIAEQLTALTDGRFKVAYEPRQWLCDDNGENDDKTSRGHVFTGYYNDFDFGHSQGVNGFDVDDRRGDVGKLLAAELRRAISIYEGIAKRLEADAPESIAD